jgi:hexosaminidase
MLEPGQGNLVIHASTVLSYNDPAFIGEVQVFNDYLKTGYGFTLKTELSNKRKPGSIFIALSRQLTGSNYELSIDSDGVFITGGDPAGVFYALQTLKQLLPAGKIKELSLPLLKIEDGPRFNYRGMHLDVVRHFFPVSFIKEYIDYLALYKMNYFHWHLTDDQGWRIEIKKYPRLQSVGAWRNGTLIGHLNDRPWKFDTIRYGGFYTQEEIKEIVRYATARHIEIIPEIEMPGHATAALAAYPEYSCTGGPFETARSWGVFNDVFCPREETFNFLQDILDEVCSLFPGKYVHIGGDECPKDRWKECGHCQELIKKENLGDAEGLQRYFTNRISAYLRTKNKTAVGWDEILNPALDSHAVILSWRGYRGAVEGATRGHDVIMAPYSHCYFDYYQSRFTDGKLAIGGYLPLDVVYGFEPVPDALSNQQVPRILGAQGNVWTEYITNKGDLQEMIFPRMSALAEVLWSPKSARDYRSFTGRLQAHFKFLKFIGVRYSTAMYEIASRVTPATGKGIEIELYSAFPGGKIHYTLDGTDPSRNSPVMDQKLTVDQSVGIRAAIFEGVQQRGSVFIRNFSVNAATARPVILAHPPHPEYSTGGTFSLVDGVTGNLPWIPSEWLGFQGEDLEAVIDLGSELRVSRVTLDVLKDEAGRIYLPREVSVFTSKDGIDFVPAGTLDEKEINKMQRKLRVQFPPVSTKWIKVVAKNRNGKDWLFIDEIAVE